MERAQDRGEARRIVSVDAVRGVVIALMVLVNDAGETSSAPSILRHAPAGTGTMTPADAVFPAFLFLVGMSVPLALSRQQRRGASCWAILRKVLSRTLALLVMGVFIGAHRESTAVDPKLWMGLSYLCFFAIWTTFPSESDLRRRGASVVRGVGIIGLLVLASVHRGPSGERMVLEPLFEPSSHVWLRHGWWEILGCIGWAYLVTCAAYLAVGARPWRLACLVPVAVSLYALEEAGCFAAEAAWAGAPLRGVVLFVNEHIGLGRQLGVYAATSIAGCALGATLVAGGTGTAEELLRVRAGLVAALALGAFALVLVPLYGVEKSGGAPGWALSSAALTAALWALVHFTTEVKARRAWTGLVAPAGASPLTAYLLHPLLRGVLVALPGLEIVRWYGHEDRAPIAATLGALAMTLFVIWCTGRLVRARITMRV